MATEFARKDYAHAEGRVAKTIEDQTARLPSDAFLWMAVGSMAVSATLQMMGNRHVSLFVGQWAPTVSDLRALQQTRETARVGPHGERGVERRPSIPSLARRACQSVVARLRIPRSHTYASRIIYVSARRPRCSRQDGP